MAESGVKIAKDAYGERTESVCYLNIGIESQGGKVIDDVANKSYDHHDRCLFPFALIDHDKAKSEWRNEDEFEPGRCIGPT